MPDIGILILILIFMVFACAIVGTAFHDWKGLRALDKEYEVRKKVTAAALQMIRRSRRKKMRADEISRVRLRCPKQTCGVAFEVTLDQLYQVAKHQSRCPGCGLPWLCNKEGVQNPLRQLAEAVDQLKTLKKQLTVELLVGTPLFFRAPSCKSSAAR